MAHFGRQGGCPGETRLAATLTRNSRRGNHINRRKSDGDTKTAVVRAANSQKNGCSQLKSIRRTGGQESEVRPIVLLLVPLTFLVASRVEIFFEIEYPTVLFPNVFEFVDPRALDRHDVLSTSAVFGDFFPFGCEYRRSTAWNVPDRLGLYFFYRDRSTSGLVDNALCAAIVGWKDKLESKGLFQADGYKASEIVFGGRSITAR